MKAYHLITRLRELILRGKMTTRIIYINLLVYLLLAVFGLLSRGNIIAWDLVQFFRFPTLLSEFLWQPWTLISSVVAHLNLDHFFFNMLFLFFSGLMFEELFGGKKLALLFILGGIGGNLAELLATTAFPDLFPPHFVLGASGSIMAIFSAVVFYRPQTPVHLFGIFPLPIYMLALFFFAKDLIGIGSQDSIAHFAHLGGALVGFFAQYKADSSGNLLTRILTLFTKKAYKKHPKQSRPKTDDEYNTERMNTQERIDKILDKISKSGYESLTREEKAFLFNQGKK